MKLLISSEDLSALWANDTNLHYLCELSTPGWYQFSSTQPRLLDTPEPKTNLVLLKVSGKLISSCLERCSKDYHADPNIIILFNPGSEHTSRLQIQRVFTQRLDGHLKIIIYPSHQIIRSVFHNLYQKDDNCFNFIPLIGSAYSCAVSTNWYARCVKMLLSVHR